MVRPVSLVASFIYVRIAKPLLFLMSPDFVHESMIRSGNYLQRSRFICWITRRMLAYEDPILNVDVLGIKYKNPLGLSAGLDKDAKIVPMLQAIGFGFVECGSVTLDAYEGNPKPWYTRLPKSKSIVVNSGLRSEGAHAVLRRAKSYPGALLKDFPLNISIAKTNSTKTSSREAGITDYIDSLKLWEKTGNARLYTINISCPNTFGGEPFTDPESLDLLLKKVDKLHIKKPVFVKFPIDKSWTDTKKLLEVCARHQRFGHYTRKSIQRSYNSKASRSI
jgi:dihydroorotate dehydrogenase